MDVSQDTARRVRNALDRFWWQPPDRELLAMLRERDMERNRSNIRWGLWAAVISYIVYGILDGLLLPDVAERVIATRLVLGAGFLIGIELCIRLGVRQMSLHIVAASAIVIGGIGWFYQAIGTTHQVALSYFLVFGTLFVLGSNLFFNFNVWLALVASTTITVFFIAAALVSVEMSRSGEITLVVFFLNCLVLSLYLSMRLRLERYQTFVQSLQARIQEEVAIEQGRMLNEMANTDPLTGLKNRRAIIRDFQAMWKTLALGEQQIGMVLVDIDFFKRFNDHLGHQAGDDCLLRIAGALTKAAAAFDGVAGRHGGEEFIVICTANDEGALVDLARHVCQSVEALKIVHPARDDGRAFVTISAGASMSKLGARPDFNGLLHEADRALYAAKFAGRAQFSVFDAEFAADDRSAHNLTHLLKEARSKQLVSAVCQPIEDLRTGKLFGYETLMRLSDYDGTMISPNVFIAEAEKNGTIIDLGQWIIECACEDLAVLERDVVISVNVSGVQLATTGFPLQVADTVARYDLAPNRLALEITEGMDIFAEAQALKNVEELRRFGVQIWLDDFGTGFAGLAWLRQFEFDVVKIDRAFLQDCHSAHGVRMLQDMVQLLRNRGIRVLVEGVETSEQKQLLNHMDVDLAQGFGIGEPRRRHSERYAARRRVPGKA
ncbi:putative bifunctional diguanylate cyclase/phosphodiesterase [Pararhizobium mangrovi]|uniref:EAL domain-containing protein n=1 Tax=Pararhizobium mangrovi TaxID=2590452 RepID=A0A506U930_9HYPH|nr:EAL domain-containing protein [Pararhizobium mangrovi]TPW29591.1 EAL domain-containing protein [Pararhizobium mangrovi]